MSSTDADQLLDDFLQSVEGVHEAISPLLGVSPLIRSEALSTQTGLEVFLKCENQMPATMKPATKFFDLKLIEVLPWVARKLNPNTSCNSLKAIVSNPNRFSTMRPFYGFIFTTLAFGYWLGHDHHEKNAIYH
ncbi:hypothetical protein H696_01761 [Fonticula alba]|uniref:Uncharacterized protein n=1 Tax=Fonticula alba TaxID=691883 RepID=A0A058ZEL9_FONAL|nr:hypothetical protein H696_01761 [Fonticula alba]KCV72368.1 hypothetical protein H696_01761 [Fonticula alba]|eukprot:XP_009493946.1 hypothetical protein H696_01761 [Fonticula alba]